MTKSSDAVYKPVMCLIALAGGRDFLKVKMLEFSTLDDHHIFPKSRADEFKAGDVINAITNRTLIERETNEKYIKDSRPSDYLKRIMDEQGVSEVEMRKRLETHLMGPKEFDAMMNNDYSGFTTARANRIVQTFAKLLQPSDESRFAA